MGKRLDLAVICFNCLLLLGIFTDRDGEQQPVKEAAPPAAVNVGALNPEWTVQELISRLRSGDVQPMKAWFAPELWTYFSDDLMRCKVLL